MVIDSESCMMFYQFFDPSFTLRSHHARIDPHVGEMISFHRESACSLEKRQGFRLRGRIGSASAATRRGTRTFKAFQPYSVVPLVLKVGSAYRSQSYVRGACSCSFGINRHVHGHDHDDTGSVRGSSPVNRGRSIKFAITRASRSPPARQRRGAKEDSRSCAGRRRR